MKNIESILEKTTGEKVETEMQFNEFDKKLTTDSMIAYVNNDLVVVEYHGLELTHFDNPFWEKVIQGIESQYNVDCDLTSEGYLPQTRNRPLKQCQVFSKEIRENPEHEIRAVYNAGQAFEHIIGAQANLMLTMIPKDLRVYED